MSSLRPLYKNTLPDFTIFSQEGLTEELVAKIKLHPEWNELWDGEVEENGSMMIINFFTYLFNKNAQAFNRWLKESILIYADDPTSIVNGLASYGLFLPQNKGASVELVMTANAPNYIFAPFSIQPGRQISGTDLDGAPIIFEIYKRSQINPSQPNYIESTVVEPGVNATLNSFNCVAFAGQTRVKTIQITEDTLEKFTIPIEDTDIIEDSIEIYFDLYGSNQTRLIPTKTYIKIKSYNSYFDNATNGIPMFKPIMDGDGRASIVFGTKAFGGDFPVKALGGELTIFYRVGGGLTSNIKKNSINTNIVFDITPGSPVSFTATNQVVASGGADRANVYEEQFYAPYRIGRTGAITTDTDALDVLRNMVSKHKVESPKYSETTNKVNVLHTNNYIVPFRDFLDFIFPTPLPNDTIASYTARFNDELQKYCNLDKIHDGIIENELVSEFFDSDFAYNLKLQKPLSGTLYLSAFNDDGKEIDRLYFKGNYSGSDVIPNQPSLSAFVKSNVQIPAITINSGNNRLLLKIDENINDSNLIANNGLIELILTSSVYGVDENGFNTDIANEIDRAIKDHPDIRYYGENFPNHKFAFIDDLGKLVIQSPTVGEFSLIQIIDNTNSNASAITTLNLNVEFKRPEPESGLIFSQNTRLDHVLSALRIAFNRNRESVTAIREGLIQDWNLDSPTGAVVQIPLVPLDGDSLDYAKPGSTVTVIALTDSNIELDRIEFSAIQESDVNPAIISLLGTGDVFDLSATNYDWFSGRLSVKLRDDIESGGNYTFNAYLIAGDPIIRGVDISDFPRLKLGQLITGTGIQAGTTITAFNQDSGTIELSLAPNVSSPLDIFEYSLPTPDTFEAVATLGSNVVRFIPSVVLNTLVVGDEIINAKFPSGTTILSKNVSAGTITVSNNATGTTGKTAMTISPSYTFPTAYNKTTKFRIDYARKLWSFVSATYKPNPYFPEGESGSILSYLRSIDKKLISMEPLTKKVNFVPLKISASLTPIPGSDKTRIRENSFELLENYFGFNSIDPAHTIGSGFSIDLLKSYLTDGLNRNPGVNFGSILTPDNNFFDSEGNSFYFVFTRDFISRIRLFEENYPQISGFYRQFENDIIVTTPVLA